MGLFTELKRRNVIRVAVAYIVASWLLLQATEVLVSLLELPSSIGKGVVLVLVLGFLPVLGFAWAFELTPEGLKRESEIDRSQSVTQQTGRKLNILTIAMLVVIAGYFFWESRIKAPVATAVPEVTSEAVEQAPARAAVPDDKSIAVLPFVNMSADPENEYFADGLSEEILNQLAQVSGLRVIGRTSSFAFKGQNRDLREIGETLGAATVLEGSVRRQGDKVRVTAQLIASDDGAHLWSENFDRQMVDVFAIQDEIAQRVVDAMDIVLDEDSRKAMREVGVRDVDAFIAYQRGFKKMIDAHGSSDMYDELLAANEFYDQAIAAVPDFAQAWSEKTDYYAHLVLDAQIPVLEREAALRTMRELQDTAIETARDDRRRLTVEVDRIFFSEDWSRLPGVLESLFGSEGCADGNWMELALPFAPPEQLLRHYQHRIECDPLFMLSYRQVAVLQVQLGNLEAARETVARARALAGETRWLRGAQLLVDLRSGDAEQRLRQLRDESQGLSSDRGELGRILPLAALGRVDEAREIADAANAQEPISALSAIITHAVTGDRDAANAAAMSLDAGPGGPAELIRVINMCFCGAPFDLEATPSLAARLAEAGWSWPPPKLFDYPAKAW